MNRWRWVLLIPMLSAVPAVACGGSVSSDAARSAIGGMALQTQGGIRSFGGVLSGGASSASAGLGGSPGTGGVSLGGAAAEGGVDGLGGSMVATGGSRACARSLGCLGPIVEFVIAAHGSMNDPAGDASGLTKWEALQGKLSNAFASLPAVWAVGAVYFSQPETGCYSGFQSVPIAPLTPTQLGLLQASISEQTPGGYEPTLSAWRFGLEQLKSFSPPPDYADIRFVVLVTDGVPTVKADGCTPGNGATTHWISVAEYAALMDAVKAEGSEALIKTLVVGTPGSDDPQGAPYDPLFMLSELALAGGTAFPAGCTPVSGIPTGHTVDPRGTYCHVDLTQTEALGGPITEKFALICSAVSSCSYELPAPPQGGIAESRPIVVTWQAAGGPLEDLPQSADSNCLDGAWYVSAVDSSGNPTQIQLCPKTCDEIINAYAGGEFCLEVI